MNKKIEESDVITDVKKSLQPKVYPYWVTASDDSMNKTLKTAIYLIYGYGFYCVMAELYTMYLA